MSSIFEIICDVDCIIVVPEDDLGESVFDQRREETERIIAALDGASTLNLVMDFVNTHKFGSTALGFFVKLWKRVRDRSGRMAFCNLSPYEMEILHLTKLDQLWEMCDTRENALKAIRK